MGSSVSKRVALLLTHFFVLNAAIQNILNEKKRLYCAFIDLRKALDSINLHNLWYKLFKQGLNRKMLQLIKVMCNNVKYCVSGCKWM